MMDSLSPTKQNKRSPSPSKAPVEFLQTRKSFIINESELDQKMKHWQEYKLKGLKISRRSYHSAAVYGKSFYVYGGYEINSGILSSFVQANLDPSLETFEWKDVPVQTHTKPGPRCRHTAVSYKDKMYLYGGQINSVENTNKLIAFDFTTNEWTNIEPKSQGPTPALDSHCAMIWNKGNDKASMVVVGGFLGGKDGGYSNAVFEYDFAENQWNTLFKNVPVDSSAETEPKIPQGRTSLGAAIYKDYLYIFGGNEGNTKLNDLWQFDLNGRKWSIVKPATEIAPEARNGHTLVCYKNLLILFGGILDITHEKNDIFVFNIQKNTWVVIEKESKWIFEDQPKVAQSPSKKASQANLHGDMMKTSISQSKLVQFQKADHSNNASGNASPTSPERHGPNDTSSTGTFSKGGSPSKYTKLKLLDSLPKGVYPAKGTSDDAEESASPKQQVSAFKSSIEEKHKRDKLLRKMILLKEFEVDEDKADSLKLNTPALEAMQKSIKSLGLDDKGKEKGEMNISNTMAGLDAIRMNVEKPTDDGKSIKEGVKPVARDGHTATMMEDKMLIFGGDRHKMSFNDLFSLNLKFFDQIST